MPFQFFVVLENFKHVCDIELLIERHINGDDVRHLHQLLFLREDLTKEVLGYVLFRRQVVLHYKLTIRKNQLLTVVTHVRVEVLLRPEFC